VDTSTRLADLNGFEGVRRGVIRITDRSGASADIDLTAAIDVNDILDAKPQMAINVGAFAAIRSSSPIGPGRQPEC
jgi:flagellar hook-associated protein 2